ncbi:GDP-mannose-dependent alpha-(1-2)-phosphatidylinositol mannosyltransferase [compost metagenome]
MIAGLPIVATDFPEIRRIVRNNNVGILVPANNSPALAHALNQLVTDLELRKKLANNARSTASTLNWEEQEARLVNLYQQILPAAAPVKQAR